MNIVLVLLISTSLFALLAMNFGYQNLYWNYQYWMCWDVCLWSGPQECNEIYQTGPHTDESKTMQEMRLQNEKMQQVYEPILKQYENNLRKNSLIQDHGYSYSLPQSPSENLPVDYEYSDGLLIHKQKLEIKSPLDQESDAEKIIMIKELVFPELWVFLAFIAGFASLAGLGIMMRQKTTSK